MLVETSDVVGLHARLRAAALPDVEELVPAASTILMRFAGAVPGDLDVRLGSLPSVVTEPPASADVEIPVRYDGEDLAEVAELTGMSVDEVAERHLAAEYTVAFCGFSPGFGYLAGGDPALAVPRRHTPRARVPAGSVGLAGPYSGVYPRELPGGWQLIGRTSVQLWNLERDPPALLVPGARVRFVRSPGPAPARGPA